MMPKAKNVQNDQKFKCQAPEDDAQDKKCPKMIKKVHVKHPKMMPKTKDVQKRQKISMSMEKTCKFRSLMICLVCLNSSNRRFVTGK